jgi:hypothetical protein
MQHSYDLFWWNIQIDVGVGVGVGIGVDVDVAASEMNGVKGTRELNIYPHFLKIFRSQWSLMQNVRRYLIDDHVTIIETQREYTLRVRQR